MKKSDRYISQYALYNRAEELLFTGSAKECMAYMEITKSNTFYTALSNGSRALGKYYIYKVEPIEKTEKRCSRCGKVKPIEDFPYRSKKSGDHLRISYCRKCKNEYSAMKNAERRLKKRVKEKEENIR